MEFEHYSVLLREVVENLRLKKDGIYYDGTLGGGGHTEAILKESAPGGKVIGIDRDVDAIAAAEKRLNTDRLIAVHGNFKDVDEILDKLGIAALDGAVLDLGVSSYQLDNAERGFSYRYADAPLDMRMDRDQGLTAYDIVNGYEERELSRIFFEFGEERFSRRIAANIVNARKVQKIETSGQLVEIVRKSIPAFAQASGGHPAKRVFQAIRIEVNRELDGLDQAVISIVRRLKSGARLCVITFHSLEDRIVKHAFKYLESDCICDKSAPVCVCQKVREINIVTSKPVLPGSTELYENSRSQSAKLRVAEKIENIAKRR